MKLSSFRVTKGNKLIEAKYSRGLIETRIVDACVAKIDKARDLTPERFFEITAAELFDLHETMDKNHVHDQLKIAAENLINQKLKIPATNTWINWFSSVSAPPGEGKIVLQFSVAIKPYLFAIEGNFTSYPLKNTLLFTGSYSHRLYEFLMQWMDFGKKEFSIAELKHRLELEDQYDRTDNLKLRVIDPAIKDINKHSDILVNYTQRKTGRSVTHFIFTFKSKEPKKPAKTNSNGTKPLIPLFTGHPKYPVDSDAVLEELKQLGTKPEPKPKKILDSDKKSKITGLKRAVTHG
ncbi:MAG: replication initiation protein [Methylococcaceae bacterium]